MVARHKPGESAGGTTALIVCKRFKEHVGEGKQGTRAARRGERMFQQGGGGYGGGGYGGGGGFGRPREMHKATCADCKKECEVPFKPSGDRPVYCKECFSKRKGGSDR